MACLNLLKQEIRAIESYFPKTHERLQIVSVNVDELTCHFVDLGSGKHVIHATLTETYPNTPPVWFSESDDPKVSEAVSRLASTSGLDNHLLNQIKLLLTSLCDLFSIPVPSLEDLRVNPADAQDSTVNFGNDADTSDESENYVEVEEEEEEEEEEIPFLMEDVESPSKKSRLDEDVASEHLQVLERLKENQRRDMTGTTTGSVQATDRLMKELRTIYQSKTFKSGAYQVELVNDSLYEWNVKMFLVDGDSPLAGDLALLKEKEGQDHILLNFTFKDTFPFDHPFVRVVYPVLKAGYVMEGGSICMELVTPHGWSSAYSIESVVMQIAATLVKGKARIKFDAPKSSYSLAKAQQTFKSLLNVHEKKGWHKPPKSEG